MRCDYCKQDKSYFTELRISKESDKSVPFTRKKLICLDCLKT